MSFILLGILNSQAAGAVGGAGDYDLLETTVLTASQSSVTFSNLNSTYGTDYKHLQIRFAALHSSDQNGFMRFNGDTTTNYNWHSLLGNGSAVSSFGTSDPLIQIAFGPNSTTIPTVGVIDILNPFDSSKYTTSRTLTGSSSTANNIKLMSGLWRNTASLTSIQLGEVNGSYKAGSRFSLYGLKESA